MLTTVRHIFGRIMHSETALHSQWDKGRKNNLLFASPSIRRPTTKRWTAQTLTVAGMKASSTRCRWIWVEFSRGKASLRR